MTLSTQDALIYVMVIAASSDTRISERELARIEALVGRLPVFEGFDKDRLSPVARECLELITDTHNLDGLVDTVVEAIPARLHDTAYALAVEVTAVDLELPQEELRFLEMLRDRLSIDRLVTAAIEAAARARLRRA